MVVQTRRASVAGEKLAHLEVSPVAKKAPRRRHSVWLDRSAEQELVILDDDGSEREIAILQKPVRKRRSRRGQKPELNAEVEGGRTQAAKKARKCRGQPEVPVDENRAQQEVLPIKKTRKVDESSSTSTTDSGGDRQPEDRTAKKGRSRREGEPSSNADVRPVKKARNRQPEADVDCAQPEDIPSMVSTAESEKSKLKKRRDRHRRRVDESSSTSTINDVDAEAEGSSEVRLAKKARKCRREQVDDRPSSTSENLDAESESSVTHLKAPRTKMVRGHRSRPEVEVSSKKKHDRRRWSSGQPVQEPNTEEADGDTESDAVIQAKRDRRKRRVEKDRHSHARVDPTPQPAPKETAKKNRHHRSHRVKVPSPPSAVRAQTSTIAKKHRDHRHRSDQMPPSFARAILRLVFNSPVEAVQESDVDEVESTKKSRNRRNRQLEELSAPPVQVLDSDDDSDVMIISDSATESESDVQEPVEELDDTCVIVENTIDIVDVDEVAETNDLVSQVMKIIKKKYKDGAKLLEEEEKLGAIKVEKGN